MSSLVLFEIYQVVMERLQWGKVFVKNARCGGVQANRAIWLR